jgi:hypothetical protein
MAVLLLAAGLAGALLYFAHPCAAPSEAANPQTGH